MDNVYDTYTERLNQLPVAWLGELYLSCQPTHHLPSGVSNGGRRVLTSMLRDLLAHNEMEMIAFERHLTGIETRYQMEHMQFRRLESDSLGTRLRRLGVEQLVHLYRSSSGGGPLASKGWGRVTLTLELHRIAERLGDDFESHLCSAEADIATRKDAVNAAMQERRSTYPHHASRFDRLTSAQLRRLLNSCPIPHPISVRRVVLRSIVEGYLYDILQKHDTAFNTHLDSFESNLVASTTANNHLIQEVKEMYPDYATRFEKLSRLQGTQLYSLCLPDQPSPDYTSKADVDVAIYTYIRQKGAAFEGYLNQIEKAGAISKEERTLLSQEPTGYESRLARLTLLHLQCLLRRLPVRTKHPPHCRRARDELLSILHGHASELGSDFGTYLDEIEAEIHATDPIVQEGRAAYPHYARKFEKLTIQQLHQLRATHPNGTAFSLTTRALRTSVESCLYTLLNEPNAAFDACLDALVTNVVMKENRMDSSTMQEGRAAYPDYARRFEKLTIQQLCGLKASHPNQALVRMPRDPPRAVVESCLYTLLQTPAAAFDAHLDALMAHVVMEEEDEIDRKVREGRAAYPYYARRFKKLRVEQLCTLRASHPNKALARMPHKPRRAVVESCLYTLLQTPAAAFDARLDALMANVVMEGEDNEERSMNGGAKMVTEKDMVATIAPEEDAAEMAGDAEIISMATQKKRTAYPLYALRFHTLTTPQLIQLHDSYPNAFPLPHPVSRARAEDGLYNLLQEHGVSFGAYTDNFEASLGVIEAMGADFRAEHPNYAARLQKLAFSQQARLYTLCSPFRVVNAGSIATRSKVAIRTICRFAQQVGSDFEPYLHQVESVVRKGEEATLGQSELLLSMEEGTTNSPTPGTTRYESRLAKLSASYLAGLYESLPHRTLQSAEHRFARADLEQKIRRVASALENAFESYLDCIESDAAAEQSIISTLVQHGRATYPSYAFRFDRLDRRQLVRLNNLHSRAFPCPKMASRATAEHGLYVLVRDQKAILDARLEDLEAGKTAIVTRKENEATDFHTAYPEYALQLSRLTDVQVARLYALCQPDHPLPKERMRKRRERGEAGIYAYVHLGGTGFDSYLQQATANYEQRLKKLTVPHLHSLRQMLPSHLQSLPGPPAPCLSRWTKSQLVTDLHRSATGLGSGFEDYLAKIEATIGTNEDMINAAVQKGRLAYPQLASRLDRLFISQLAELYDSYPTVTVPMTKRPYPSRAKVESTVYQLLSGQESTFTTHLDAFEADALATSCAVKDFNKTYPGYAERLARLPGYARVRLHNLCLPHRVIGSKGWGWLLPYEVESAIHGFVRQVGAGFEPYLHRFETGLSRESRAPIAQEYADRLDKLEDWQLRQLYDSCPSVQSNLMDNDRRVDVESKIYQLIDRMGADFSVYLQEIEMGCKTTKGPSSRKRRKVH